jgi:rhodanese-related sulfurtransferase
LGVLHTESAMAGRTLQDEKPQGTGTMDDPSSSSPLVSAEWLAAHLDDPDLRIVDVRWCLRVEEGHEVTFDDRDGYLAGHIPGAVFVGMQQELSDPDQAVPDMLAPSERFARVMGRLGIGADTLVVTYDAMAVPLGSARLWWALCHYGHSRVRVLDGGLRQWQALGSVIFGGLLVATVLSLGVVPPFYVFMKQLQGRRPSRAGTAAAQET